MKELTVKATIVNAINTLSLFCGRRDVEELTQNELQKRFGIRQADVMVLFGGSIICGGDELAKAMLANVAKTYLIVGGEGHTTSTLRNKIQQLLPTALVDNKTEAELFDEYISKKYGLKADYLECRSTNCGNNISNLLELLREKKIDFRSIILMQDATMQNRMDAVLRKYVTDDTCIINYAAYLAQLRIEGNKPEYSIDITGMWDFEHFISLLLGEIPRLTDDENGYGPKGKDFIAHVDIPESVSNAFRDLAMAYPHLIREADPKYASK